MGYYKQQMIERESSMNEDELHDLELEKRATATSRVRDEQRELYLLRDFAEHIAQHAQRLLDEHYFLTGPALGLEKKFRYVEWGYLETKHLYEAVAGTSLAHSISDRLRRINASLRARCVHCGELLNAAEGLEHSTCGEDYRRYCREIDRESGQPEEDR